MDELRSKDKQPDREDYLELRDGAVKSLKTNMISIQVNEAILKLVDKMLKYLPDEKEKVNRVVG